MKITQLIGKRLRHAPKDASTKSHIYLVRGGYIRQVSAGIYTLLPLGKKITAKIEAVIRQEMASVGGQEVLMPVVLPAELWEESGRINDIGPELVRFRDRNGKALLLGMTHEEAVVHLARSEIDSYKQLPAMLYQIQTKYRDEARPRAALIRTREFTMKDAYSFHATEASLEESYKKMYASYEKIFQRVGLKDVVAIESDPGMMGGSVSHEFMAVADCGEDTIILSEDRTYRANKDIATAQYHYPQEEMLPLEKVHTPKQKTINEVATFLKLEKERMAKAVFYLDDAENIVFVVIRGDLEVNETKLCNYAKIKHLRSANDEQIRGIGTVPGFASPLGIISDNVRIFCDPSVWNMPNIVVGANEEEYHYQNFNAKRDLKTGEKTIEVVDIAMVKEGDMCPITGKKLIFQRGIEVGNIFKLGQKYSRSMHCSYLDDVGNEQYMTMGCYGIGIGRLMAAVIEQSHDQYGPIWPQSIAPFQVHICALHSQNKAVKEQADNLYHQLMELGVDVLYDDRPEKAGYMFNDADLIGAPFRLILSAKTVAKGQIEFRSRDRSQVEFIATPDLLPFLQSLGVGYKQL